MHTSPRDPQTNLLTPVLVGWFSVYLLSQVQIHRPELPQMLTKKISQSSTSNFVGL